MALRLFSTEFSAEFDSLWELPTTGARPRFAYPFYLGSVAETVPEVPLATRWTTLSPDRLGWQTLGSNRHRFERVYARPASGFGQSVNFNYEIRSQFPLILYADQQAVIASTITNP